MDDEKTAADELFIVGDIHGDLIGLNRELWARGLLRGGRWHKGSHLVCVGDYTDRNRGGAAVLRLLRPLEEDGLVTCLLGNHDVAILGTALLLRRLGSLPPAFTQRSAQTSDTLDDESSILAWLFHSCGALMEDVQALAEDDVLLTWLRRRPLIGRYGDLLIVHADNAQPLLWGTTVEEVNALGRRITEGDNLADLLALFSNLTERYAFVGEDDKDFTLHGDARGPRARAAAPALLSEMLSRFGGRALVHGHSVFSTGDAAPLVYAGGRAVNVDRGAGYPDRGGKLCLTSRAELISRLDREVAARVSGTAEWG